MNHPKDMKDKRVFVVDYDIISPLGIGKSEVFKNLLNNHSAEDVITKFNTQGLPINIAAEIIPSLEKLYRNESIAIRSALKYDRKLELMVACYHFMEKRLKNIFQYVLPEKSGVILGMGADVPSVELMEEQILKFIDKSEDPFLETVNSLNNHNGSINTLLNPLDISAIYLSSKLGLAAFQKSVLTTCAASIQAISLSCEAIKRGDAEIVLAGGTDSIINALAFMSFSKLGILAPKLNTIGKNCKPFDINRSGTLAGEAAGLCVLASKKVVDDLKLNPQFEIIGYGNSLDAYKITAPDPTGNGIKRALKSAIINAFIKPEQIDYINLHGTGTRGNDPIELISLGDVFGDAIRKIPISSTKDRHGHAIAATGIQEFGILCMCMENNFIPCNLNLEIPIVKKGFDLVQKENRFKKLNIGMTNNFGFGGVNTALLIRKN